MNVNMLHINFQPKQLWIADEGLKCLTHRLKLRRGLFLSFSYIPINQNLPTLDHSSEVGEVRLAA